MKDRQSDKERDRNRQGDKEIVRQKDTYQDRHGHRDIETELWQCWIDRIEKNREFVICDTDKYNNCNKIKSS